jgi:hypothetical protein
MADELYLNLWFPSFAEAEMLIRLAAVLRQFPVSATSPGVRYVAVRPLSWDEPTIFERHYEPPVEPAETLVALEEFLHSDYCFELEMAWDLWGPVREGDLDETWKQGAYKVRFIVRGEDFGDREADENGHIQLDLGLDTHFLHEDAELIDQVETRVKSNVQKLVDMTHRIEQHAGVRGRLLWSESEEDLAQKLIARLQRVQ